MAAFPGAVTPGQAGERPPGPPPLTGEPADVFARYTRDYVSGKAGSQVAILHAGCTSAPHDLGASLLTADGADIIVTLIDDDSRVSRAAVTAQDALSAAALGDLRTVPLPPRSQDIVHCAALLDRIHHAELVLDRLVATLKPGGLLLLRIRDRDCAAGLFDRIAPRALRRLVWRSRHPGHPGPYPAVYERLSSARGVQSYALLRGLVFAERQSTGGLSDALGREPYGFLLLQKFIAWLSRQRLTAAHEELLYVLRKPENRFARLI